MGSPKSNNIYTTASLPDPSRYNPSDKDFNLHVIHSLLDSPAAESLCDVTLHTSDNLQVPACRALLAMHSDYFRTLFYSGFEESTQQTARIEMSSQVLRHILIFAYIGHCPLVLSIRKCSTFEDVFERFDDIRLLVQVAASADYCGLNVLHTWCESCLIWVCKKFPLVICTVLASISGYTKHDLLRRKLHEILADRYYKAFNVPEGLGSRSRAESRNSLYRRQRYIEVYPEETNHYGREYHPDDYDEWLLGTVQNGGYDASCGDPDPDIYGILALPPQDLDAVLAFIADSESHEHLLQCIFYWVTKGSFLSRTCCNLRVLEAANGDEKGIQEVPESISDCERNGVHYVERSRFEWGKRLAANLNPKLMRIRFVYDYVIPTGLLESIDKEELLREHMFSTTEPVREVRERTMW